MELRMQELCNLHKEVTKEVGDSVAASNLILADYMEGLAGQLLDSIGEVDASVNSLRNTIENKSC